MDEFSFGRPDGAVVQMAYFLPDVESGMAWWTAQFGVGPWFVVDRIGGDGAIYRGKPSDAEFRIAMAYSGAMNIELIQMLDERPSVYKEAREKRGYGFHHAAKAVPDLPAAVADGIARGLTVLFRSPTPGGGEVCFFDGGDDAPGMLELIADVPATRQIFSEVWRASRDWDGSRPRREFADAIAAAGLDTSG